MIHWKNKPWNNGPSSFLCCDKIVRQKPAQRRKGLFGLKFQVTVHHLRSVNAEVQAGAF